MRQADLVPPPPRKISLLFCLLLMFGHYRIRILWFFTCIFALVFAMILPVIASVEYLQRSPTAVTEGILISQQEMGKRTEYYPRDYSGDVTYQINGQALNTYARWQEESGTVRHTVGEKVKVRYSVRYPEIAEVVGMVGESAEVESQKLNFVGSLVCLLMFINLAFVWPGLQKIGIVRLGKTVQGRVKKVNLVVRNGNSLLPKVAHYTITYQVAGKTYTHKTSSDSLILYDQTHQLVRLAYDPAKPHKAVVIDGLSGHIQYNLQALALKIPQYDSQRLVILPMITMLICACSYLYTWFKFY
ncbi:MAG: hypothetical protein AB7I41_17275 [Candidatus Sericytochromatia bacterium]